MAHGAYSSENYKATIQRRRDILADYFTRGIESFTLISEAWLNEGIVHPITNEPFNYQTFVNDRAYLKQRWAQANNEKVDMLIADITVKQKRVYKEAMEHHDYISALAALKGLREVLDIDKPKGSRALKVAADERHGRGESESGLSQAEAEAHAVQLDSSPAVLGEMLQIMKENGVFHATLAQDTEQAKAALEMHAALSDGSEPFPASETATTLTNGIAANGHDNGNGIGVYDLNGNRRR